jgi:hypothetical protein
MEHLKPMAGRRPPPRPAEILARRPADNAREHEPGRLEVFNPLAKERVGPSNYAPALDLKTSVQQTGAREE